MKKTIWIIDDDAGILEVTEIVLQEAGYQVKIIDNVTKLDDFLAENRPDLIILDLLLSGFDGRDISKKLKDNYHTKNIPIIMMSADPHIEQKSKEAGADSFIRKPFDIAELEETVKHFLHEK